MTFSHSFHPFPSLWHSSHIFISLLSLPPHKVVPSLLLQPRVSILLLSCARTKSLVLFQFLSTVHFVRLIIHISAHIPYTRDLYRRRAYLQTLHFVSLAHVFKFTSMFHVVLWWPITIRVAYLFLSHFGDFGWGVYPAPHYDFGCSSSLDYASFRCTLS